MEIRKSNISDIPRLLEISNDAKEFMKKNGLNQWNNGYPNEKTFKNDVLDDIGYCVVKENIVIGYFALVFGKEKTYKKTYEGNFKYTGDYSTIHRLMICGDYRGKNLTKDIFLYIQKLTQDKLVQFVRIDTHKDNIPMKKAIFSNGFTYSAIIHVEDGSERMAFEKEVNNGL